MLYTEQYEAKLRGVWEDYGEERGMEKGREKERREILSLLKKGVSTDELMKILAARR
jgi:hypothetical protein